MGKRFTIVLAMLVVAVLVAACSDTPSSFGRAFRGRSLDITVLAMDRVQELRYTNSYGAGSVDHHRLRPSEDGMELVLVRLRVANHTATSHIVDVNAQAAELQDYFQGKYLPVDVMAQGQTWARVAGAWKWEDNDSLTDLLAQTQGADITDPPDWDPGSVRLIEVGTDGTPPGQGFLVGSFKLDRGFSIDGWMVFEVPAGTEFRSLRWRAGDSLTIPF
ncbi:MAG: hypothetical protein IIC99_01805 [Chloroflexi bacterium]|nr:hypothetical protein [Chloroflexota bacterium]